VRQPRWARIGLQHQRLRIAAVVEVDEYVDAKESHRWLAGLLQSGGGSFSLLNERVDIIR